MPSVRVAPVGTFAVYIWFSARTILRTYSYGCRAEEMEHEFGEFRVYEVEVCPDCGWNHVLTHYVLGDGRRRRPPRHQPTVEDIYG